MVKLIANLLLSAGPVVLVVATATQTIGWTDINQTEIILKSGIYMLVGGISIRVLDKFVKEYEFKRSINFRQISRSDIDDVIEISDDVLNDAMSRNELKSFLDVRNNLITVQKHEYSIFGWKYESTTGFYSLIPLKKKAAKELEEENISGRQFRSIHVENKRNDSEYVYIGGIASTGVGYPIVRCLKGVIMEKRKHDVKAAYTKPTTKIGLRLAKNAVFEPVSEEVDNDELNRIYKLSM